MANEALSLEQSGPAVAMTTHYHLAPSLSHNSAPPLCPYDLLHGNLYLYIYLHHYVRRNKAKHILTKTRQIYPHETAVREST